MNIGHGVVFSDFSKNHNREKKYISRDFSTHDKGVDNFLAETQSSMWLVYSSPEVAR